MTLKQNFACSTFNLSKKKMKLTQFQRQGLTIWSRASFSVRSDIHIVTRLNIIQDSKCFCCVNSFAVGWRSLLSTSRRHQWYLDLIWDNFAITLFSCQRWPWNIEGCLVQSTERHIIWCYTRFWKKRKKNTHSIIRSAVSHWTKNLINISKSYLIKSLSSKLTWVVFQ